MNITIELLDGSNAKYNDVDGVLEIPDRNEFYVLKVPSVEAVYPLDQVDTFEGEAGESIKPNARRKSMYKDLFTDIKRKMA